MQQGHGQHVNVQVGMFNSQFRCYFDFDLRKYLYVVNNIYKDLAKVALGKFGHPPQADRRGLFIVTFKYVQSLPNVVRKKQPYWTGGKNQKM